MKAALFRLMGIFLLLACNQTQDLGQNQIQDDLTQREDMHQLLTPPDGMSLDGMPKPPDGMPTPDLESSSGVMRYTADANTVLLDHFGGSTSASILAFQKQNGCGSPFPAAIPAFSYGPGPNGLSQALTLSPPSGEPAGSGTYLQYPGGQLLSQPNGTVELWVYPTSWNTGLMGQQPYVGTCAGFTFGMSIDATGHLTSSAYAAFNVTSSTIVPLNAWTHVAATWGSSGAKLYVNGVQVGSDANTGMPAGGFGGSVITALGTDHGFSTGIDELRISNVQRTSFNLLP